MATTLRRRADNLVLRWQARLDSDWSDRFLPYLLSIGLSVLLLVLALAKYRSLEGTVDLAAYTQAAWLIGELADPIVTLTTDSHVLAQQASFLFYPVALLATLLPTVPTLLA